MKNRQHSPVARGVQKLVGMPAGGQRSRLALAVANHAAGDQVGIVKDRAVSVDERISEFSTFMNRAWCFRGGMTWDSSRKRKLLEEPSHALFILANARIDLAIGALKVRIRHHARSA